MIRQRFQSVLLVGAFVLIGTSGGHAEGPERVTFKGLINDVTIASAGSWAIHGVWSLTVRRHSNTANLSATLTMERSDSWLLTTPGADPNSVAARNPHTHHIAVTNGIVTPLTNGFRVTGAATITANGSTAPFGTSSTLQIDVTGGNVVQFSNVALTFGGDAVAHFGAQTFGGAVRRWK